MPSSTRTPHLPGHPVFTPPCPTGQGHATHPETFHPHSDKGGKRREWQTGGGPADFVWLCWVWGLSLLPGPFLTFQIPFEKNCGEDKKCEADLALSSPARSESLRLMASASLAVEWTLKNSGEDAYWVRLDLDFPQGLSFRKVEMLQPHSPIPVSCEELTEESSLLTKTLKCNVSSPIFKAGQQVSVGELPHKGPSWQTGRRPWFWGRSRWLAKEDSIQSCFAYLSLDWG